MGDSNPVPWGGTRPGVSFQATGVPPPSRVYVTLEDVLNITAQTSIAGAVPQLGMRILTPDGRIVRSLFTITPSNNRVTATFATPLTEGFLLSFAVQPGTVVNHGGLYVRAYITFNINGTFQQVLFGGYVTNNTYVGWPEYPPEQYVTGAGLIRTIVGSAPAAGADISETVPTGAIWRLHSFATSLVTAVAVANRTPRLLLDDGTNVYFRAESPLTQAASLTKFHQFGENLANVAGAIDTATAPIPGPMYIGAGYRIRTLTNNIQAADQWAAPIYQVEEWLSPS